MPSARELYLTPTKNYHYKWRHGQYCFIINKGKSGSKSLQRVLRLWKSSHKTLSKSSKSFISVWVTEKPVIYKSCLSNSSIQVHSSLHKWKQKQSSLWRPPPRDLLASNSNPICVYYTPEFRRILTTFTKFQVVLPGTVWKKRLQSGLVVPCSL